MYTAFARQILVLGTNQKKMATSRSVANHGNEADHFVWLYHLLIIVIILPLII